jgi:hypothetical protein
MSATGHQRTLVRSSAMSALPPEADMLIVGINVCYVPKADIKRVTGKEVGLAKVRQSGSRLATRMAQVLLKANLGRRHGSDVQLFRELSHHLDSTRRHC